LQLTTKSYGEVGKIVHELAHEVAGGRLVVFGGGGYNIANVARTWTVVASALIGYALPKEAPTVWQKMFEALVGEEAPECISSEGEAKHALPSDVMQNQQAEILKDLKRRISYLS
jgi:acetoin utilization protein AcuC